MLEDCRLCGDIVLVLGAVTGPLELAGERGREHMCKTNTYTMRGIILTECFSVYC